MIKLYDAGPHTVIAQHDGMIFMLTNRVDTNPLGCYIDHRGNVQQVLRKSVYGDQAVKILWP